MLLAREISSLENGWQLKHGIYLYETNIPWSLFYCTGSNMVPVELYNSLFKSLNLLRHFTKTIPVVPSPVPWRLNQSFELYDLIYVNVLRCWRKVTLESLKDKQKVNIETHQPIHYHLSTCFVTPHKLYRKIITILIQVPYFSWA